MLMYHPAQDVNHCVFRLLLILEHTEHEKLNTDVYRLIDFYTLFPSLLKLLKTLP
ncbi:ABC-three component system middle component 5, partial [Streptomyces brasiliscabiei]|uniref:ABC-three component system middle component 5 n=1 Tax=Streptomyces brasiliscabiei TaxID=2736302 RepID=UPI0038F69241